MSAAWTSLNVALSHQIRIAPGWIVFPTTNLAICRHSRSAIHPSSNSPPNPLHNLLAVRLGRGLADTGRPISSRHSSAGPMVYARSEHRRIEWLDRTGDGWLRAVTTCREFHGEDGGRLPVLASMPGIGRTVERRIPSGGAPSLIHMSTNLFLVLPVIVNSLKLPAGTVTSPRRRDPWRLVFEFGLQDREDRRIEWQFHRVSLANLEDYPLDGAGEAVGSAVMIMTTTKTPPTAAVGPRVFISIVLVPTSRATRDQRVVIFIAVELPASSSRILRP